MPLLGAIAGVPPCRGAIAGPHCSMPFLGATAGVPLRESHCWAPLRKKLARVIHHSPLHLSLYIDNTQIGLCYLGSMLAKFSGRQPRSYTASVRRRTSTTRECRERPWKPSRHRRKKKRGNYKVASSHCHIASKNIRKKKHKKEDKNDRKKTHMQRHPMHLGGRLRLPPLTATLLPRTSRRKITRRRRQK